MGYNVMLNGVFKFQGLDFSKDNVVTAITRTCCRQICHPGLKVPAWNVDIVLRALLSPPFELMDTADLKKVTMKTLFLITLATAKRVRELQALSVGVACCSKDWIISYLPEFVAKTDSATSPAERVSPLEPHSASGTGR